MTFPTNLNYDGKIVNEKAPGQAYHGKVQIFAPQNIPDKHFICSMPSDKSA